MGKYQSGNNEFDGHIAPNNRVPFLFEGPEKIKWIGEFDPKNWGKHELIWNEQLIIERIMFTFFV